MNGWKIVPKKIIYHSKFFDLKEQEITFPDGKTKTYDYVERKPTVVIFPLTESKEIYLISEFRTLYGRRTVEAIAGHIDEREEPIQTAKRELIEEAGLTGGKWTELLTLEGSASIVKSTIHLFLAQDLILGEAHPTEEEDIELLKMPLEEAVKKAREGEITTVAAVIGILLLDKMVREGEIN